ncbi:MAG: ATP-binding protein [bacterium]
MIISIASGKGGTGKTTIAVNLALSIDKEVQFLDCDVEEPNAHIFLKPKMKTSKKVSIPVPEVDDEKCNFCRKCAEFCAYNAIAVLKNKVLIFSNLCHSCGGCTLLCPQKAISEVNREIGILETGNSGGLQFIHGRLNIGEAMSSPLIRAVKEQINSDKIVIIDAPPGTSCPMIESVKGSDFSILVSEPTPFGLNDLTLAVEVLRKLSIPFGVIINRADIGDDSLERYCKNEHIPVLLRIPFDKKIAFLYSKGIPVVKEQKEYITKFNDMLNNILDKVQRNK